MISGHRKLLLFLGNVFPANLAPPHRQDLTPEEQKKYERIRSMIVEVGEKVGLSNPELVHFRITSAFEKNACMVGNNMSFSGPVMCLANDYFTHFESPAILRDSEYKEWRSRLDQIPDHPLKMGKWISSLSFEDRTRLHCLAKKFASVLTEEELKGITAHELGHAKHLHSWKKLFFILPMAWGAIKVSEVIGHFPAIFLFALGMDQVQRILEKEADEATAVSRSYSAGVKSFFKRATVAELAEPSSSSAEERAKEMIEGFDFFSSHPHPAKRVVAAIERKERPAHPISLLEKGMALIGAAMLVQEVAAIISNVWNAIFPRKEKLS